MANNIKGITVEIGGDTGPLEKSLKGVNKTVGDTQKELKEVNRQLKFDPKNTELLRQKHELLAKQIATTKDKLASLKEAEKQVEEQFQNGEIGEEKYRAFQREVAKTESQLKNLEKQARDTDTSLSASLKSAGESIEKVGKKLAPASAAAAGLGATSIKAAADFETAMAKVTTIMDPAEVSVDSMRQRIMDLSCETGIASTEISENVYSAISAGQSTGDAVNFVSNSTKLAKAGFAEAGQSLDVLTTIMNAYGLESDEVTSVSDKLITTQNLGKTTVAELASSMGRVIPTANAFGVNLDNVASSYVILTKNGIQTAEATTYLNSMLNELGKSGTKASDALKAKTGKSFTELVQSGMSVADVLKILQGSASEAGLSMADMFGSAEAGKAALTIMGDGGAEFSQTLDDMAGSAGATQIAFDKMDATPAATAQKTLNELKNTLAELGETLLQMLGPALGKIRSLAGQLNDKVKNLSDGQKKVLSALILAVAAAAPALMIVGRMTRDLGSLIQGIRAFAPIVSKVKMIGPLFKGIGGAFSALLSPAGLVVLAVAGIATAAVLIIKNWEPIKGFFKGIWDNIKETFSGAGEWFSGIWSGVKQVFVSAWTGIKTAVMTIVNVFVQDILNIWGSMKTGIETIMNGLKAILSGIWLAIKTVVLGPVLLILDLVTGNFKKLSSDSQGIFNNLKAAFSTIWAGIKQVFSGALQAITGLVKTEWNGIKTFASTLWNSVGEIIKTAWSGFKSTISTLCNDISSGIKTVWNGILNWFKELPGKLKQIGSDMFTRMKEGINSTIHGVGDAVKTGISTAFDVIKNLPSEALQWGKDIVQGIANGIKSAAHAVGDAVNGVAQDIRKFLHFSVPDEGPLADFDTYMPDMMHLMAEGITDNLSVVTDATKQVAGSIAAESGKAVDTAVSVVKGRLGITFGSSAVTADVGFKLGRGLSDGIEKSKTVVLKTAKNMSNLLTAEETRLQNQIAEIQKQTAAQTQKSNEEILQDNLNAQLKIVQDFKKQYDDAIAEVEKAQADMANKLIAFGDLFTKTQSEFGDMFSVNDLQGQINAINGYGDALEKLKARGVSDSLLSKIKDMSIEDATQYTTQLLSMTDEQYGKYMTLWDQKQQAAKSVAEKFYKGELDTLKAEYVDKIPSELSGIKDQMKDIGVMSGQGLADGFASQSAMITATFVGVLQAAYADAKESMDIHSPSRKWAYIGEQNAAGLGVGFVEKMKSVTKQMSDSIPTNIVLGSNETPSAARMNEGLVNGLAAVLNTPQGGAAVPGGTYKINVMMPNGDVLASAVFDPLRDLVQQKGTALA